MAKKILIADDDVDMLILIASRLKANNYEVIVAKDGIQAIAETHKNKPDLIILDINMPAGSGISVFDNLRMTNDTLTIPVIFITGYSSEEMRYKAMEMGAADYITKPFNSEDLLSKIKKVLSETGKEEK